MKWDYKLPRRDALINVISNNFEKSKEIDVYDLANDIEKYIKATHLKRKPTKHNRINTIDWAIDVWKEIIRKPCKKCKQPTQTIVDICCNCNFPKGEK